MRRFCLPAILAVPLLLTGSGTARANPNGYEYFGWSNFGYFGCSGACYKKFQFIHQHGPLFNYGPYYGYYPFCPYGPWDAYLRFDSSYTASGQVGDVYGLHPRIRQNLQALHSALSYVGSCAADFFHASWVHGGWYHGHKWLDGGHGCGHARGCNSCGGVAVPVQPAPGCDPAKKLCGIGTPTQSAVFYAATPTLDPRLELIPAGGRTR
jgi:hypothetical protein